MMQQARDLLDAGVRVIDLAADFRIKDVQVWEKWYGMSHACPDLIEQAVYGLPEICQGLSAVVNHAVDLTFVPHLTP